MRTLSISGQNLGHLGHSFLIITLFNFVIDYDLLCYFFRKKQQTNRNNIQDFCFTKLREKREKREKTDLISTLELYTHFLPFPHSCPFDHMFLSIRYLVLSKREKERKRERENKLLNIDQYNLYF
jgi:hypothetical protein